MLVMNYKTFSQRMADVNRQIKESKDRINKLRQWQSSGHNLNSLFSEADFEVDNQSFITEIEALEKRIYEVEQQKSELLKMLQTIESPLKMNVERLCAENKISVSHLEKALGFGNGSIRRWDTTAPSIDKVLKVAEYFSVSLDELYDREGLRSNTTTDLMVVLSEREYVVTIGDILLSNGEKNELLGLAERLYT